MGFQAIALFEPWRQGTRMLPAFLIRPTKPTCSNHRRISANAAMRDRNIPGLPSVAIKDGNDQKCRANTRNTLTRTTILI